MSYSKSAKLTGSSPIPRMHQSNNVKERCFCVFTGLMHAWICFQIDKTVPTLASTYTSVELGPKENDICNHLAH